MIKYLSMQENQAKRRRTTSNSVTGGISEVMKAQWKVPAFFGLNVDKNQSIKSPPFSFAGCKWNLLVYPKGNGKDGVSVYLCLNDPITAVTLKSFSIDMEEEDVIMTKYQYTFKPKSSWGWHFLSLREIENRRAVLKTKAVIFTCRMEHEVDTSEGVASNSEDVDCGLTELVELDVLSLDFKDLLSSERNCDVTIDVLGKEYRAHRAVLVARSSVFRAMYEHDTSEAKSGALKIPDCDPEFFGVFIHFLYSGRLELNSFSAAYHLYSIADKYDVQQLKSFCAEYLRRNLTTDNFPEIAMMAHLHADDILMSSVQALFNKKYREIFRKSNWKVMVENNPRLVSKLLDKMASTSEKIS